MAVNILFTASWLSNRNSRVMKPHGITLQQYNVLRILRGQHPNPASVGLIQERMLDKSSNASRLTDKLVLKKLVERKICPDDRRQMDVKISQKGLDLLAKLDADMKELDKEINSNLTEQEAKIVGELLDKLRG
ncbi:MAG: MarR family transcriptional regulator [Bacteroidia bacterium]